MIDAVGKYGVRITCQGNDSFFFTEKKELTERNGMKERDTYSDLIVLLVGFLFRLGKIHLKDLRRLSRR